MLSLPDQQELVVREAPHPLAAAAAESSLMPLVRRTPIMKLIPSWLSQLIGDAQFDATVERIARFAEESAWQRVQVTGSTLEPFALRGYLRARSALIIRQQVAAEIGSKSVSAKYRQRLTEAVGELLIRMMTHRLAVARVTTTPVRRAA